MFLAKRICAIRQVACTRNRWKKNNNNNDTQCQNKEEKWQQTKNNTPYAKQFVLFAVLRCYRCFISCHLFSWKCSTKQIGCNQRKSKQNVSLISKADSFYPSLSLSFTSILFVMSFFLVSTSQLVSSYIFSSSLL